MQAYNGQQACEMVDKMIQCNEDPFALIFMDIDMPVMNGVDASKAIKEKIGAQSPFRDAVKIIMCSAYHTDEQKRLCLSSGADYYATKPLSRDKVLEILKFFS